MSIEVLGGFRVHVGGRPVPAAAWRLRTARSLLKLLALTPAHRLHREQILELLWPAQDPAAATRSLHYTLHTLRRTLEPDLRRGTPSAYLPLRQDVLLLCPDPDTPLWIDLDAFETAGDAAGRAGGADPVAYEAALALYPGDVLPEDRYEEWTVARREGARTLYLGLLIELAGLYEARGAREAAIRALERLVAAEPADEEGHVGLMRLYALEGRRHQALRQYQALKEALERELDATPEVESARLYRAILAGRFPASPAGGADGQEASSPASARTTSQDTAATPPLEATTEVAAQLAMAAAPLAVPEAERPTNLPHALTAFIGREQEVAEVRALLGATRLLTLTGAGGSGKTRLALEVARGLRSDYRDGVWLVELAGLSDPALVPVEVATRLGVREEAGRAVVETLVEAVRGRELLLVLDNCEHLIAACAQLAERLLQACPRLRLLVTSRTGLSVAGEIAWRVPPLPAPRPDRLTALTLAQVVAHDAVRLFVARAQLSRPGFVLTEQNVGAVAQVCWRLDGLPLALELAAARLKVLTVEELAGRLDNAFAVLTAGSRTALPRQQTLRATMEWSYRLLSVPEQVLLRQLAVFAGGWTLEAAETVCASEEIAAEAVLDVLAGLVDQSLVVVDERAEGIRYRLLEVVRQYAAEQLEEAGEAAAVRERHAAWCLTLAEMAAAQLHGPDQARWLERLETEHDNMRVALRWALEGGALPAARSSASALGIRLARALSRFWYVRGYLSEGRAWLEQAVALDMDDGDNALLLVRAHALNGLGDIVREQGDFARAADLYEQDLALFRRLDDTTGVALALNSLGATAVRQGDFARAAALYEESLALGRATGDKARLMFVLGSLGEVASSQGNHQRATALYEEGLALARELGDRGGITFALCNLGNGAYRRGEYARAAALYEEGLAVARELGDKVDVALLLNNLGATARDQGQYEQARGLLEESLALRRELCDRRGMAVSLCTLGMIVRAEGDVERAKALLTESLTLARDIGDKWCIGRTLCALGRVARDVGDYERAVTLYKESLTLYSGMRDAIGVAAALEGMADLAVAQGQADRAARLFGAVAALRAATSAPLPPADWAAHERDVARVRAILGKTTFRTAWAAGMGLSMEEAIIAALSPTPPPSADPAAPKAGQVFPLTLTARERQIATLIARGLTNRQIAAELGMAERTADTHVGHILKRLGVSSRAEVAARLG